MTWTYKILNDGSALEVYNSAGTLVKTVPNDGSGFQAEKEVMQALEEAAIAEYQANGFSAELLQLLRHAIFENIEADTPTV